MTETCAVVPFLTDAEPPGIVTFGAPGGTRDEAADVLPGMQRQLLAACIAVASRYGANDDVGIVTVADDGAPLLVRARLTATTTFAELVARLEEHPATLEALDARGLLQVGIVTSSRHDAAWLDRVGLLFRVDADSGIVRIAFDDAAYPRWFADQLAEHYATTLATLLGEPHLAVAGYDLLGEAMRRTLAVDSNPPEIAVTSDDDLVTRFEARVAAAPDAVALTCEGRRITYAQLDTMANTVAASLALDHAVDEGDLVAILLDRTEWVVVAILAVLKTGAAYLPVDPAYPKSRVEHMLRDSGARLLISERQFLGEYEGRDIHALAASPLRPLPPRSRSIHRLAYVIYTSGSTGLPKGVLITHRNVARLFESTDPSYRFTADDVWLLFHSPAFDFSVWELWGALLYGGRLVVPGYVVSRDPQAVYALVQEEGVTVLNQTPSAFRQFDAVDAERRAPLALRFVVFAGEMLDPSSLAGWFERHGDDRPRMINMYGITETTVHVTWRRIVQGDLGSGSVVGGAIDGWQIHLLDRHGNLVPYGVAGEIHVGGDGVARGYLNRAELTAQRFLPDRFSTRADATLYRSGDLARRLPDGDLEYLGRIDHQVKVRGFRIELGEIEHCLAAHPAVSDVAVLPVDSADGVELVAFLFGAPQVKTRELRQFLRRSVPPYMVPSRFIGVAERPLTSNGKLDRRLLLSLANEGGAA